MKIDPYTKKDLRNKFLIGGWICCWLGSVWIPGYQFQLFWSGSFMAGLRVLARIIER